MVLNADDVGQVNPGGPDVEFFDAAAGIVLQDVEMQRPGILADAVWALARLRVCGLWFNPSSI